MGAGSGSRRDLIKNVWPDKALFGATLLLITALLGLVQGLALMAIPIKTAGAVARLTDLYPPIVTAALSATAAVFAVLALRRQRSTHAAIGAGVGFFAFGMVGLGSLLSLVALVFALMSRAEGEDAATDALRVHALAWPDKALAASTVALVLGVLTLGWGIALSAEAIEFSGYTSDPVAFGYAGIAVGILSIAASTLLYLQRAPLVGVAAGVGGLLALGLYVVGPILGLVMLWLVYKAWREDEFSSKPAPPASTATPRASVPAAPRARR